MGVAIEFPTVRWPTRLFRILFDYTFPQQYSYIEFRCYLLHSAAFRCHFLDEPVFATPDIGEREGQRPTPGFASLVSCHTRHSYKSFVSQTHLRECTLRLPITYKGRQLCILLFNTSFLAFAISTSKYAGSPPRICV